MGQLVLLDHEHAVDLLSDRLTKLISDLDVIIYLLDIVHLADELLEVGITAAIIVEDDEQDADNILLLAKTVDELRQFIVE